MNDPLSLSHDRRIGSALFGRSALSILAVASTLAACLIGLAAHAQAAALYAVDESTNELVIIDGDTGATQSIGIVGFPNVVALAFDTRSGVLYGISRPGTFFTADLIGINQETGAGTFLAPVLYFAGTPSEQTGTAVNLAFDPITDLLVAGGGTALSNFGIYVIDQDSGVADFDQGTTFSATGLSFHPVTGRAFDIVGTSLRSTDIFAPFPDNSSELVGSIPGLLMFAGRDLIAMDSTGDNLFAIVVTQSSGTQLVTIDATTAALTIIGGVSTELDAVTGVELIPETLIVPEPSIPLASAIGLLFLFCMGCRASPFGRLSSRRRPGSDASLFLLGN